MTARKIIGWLLFAFGIPSFFIIITVSKETTGHFTVGILIGILIVGAGWILAHPKER